MTRLLFVVPPLVGHITPLVAVAERLTAAGHTVLWYGQPDLVRSLAGQQAVVRPAGELAVRGGRAWEHLRGYAALRYLWEDFLVPLADADVAAVTAAAERDQVDLVVADMQALAGPLAAARLGLPWATSATTSAPLRESLAATPKVRAWLDGLFSGLIERHCRDAPRQLTPRQLELSPDLVIAFTTELLVGGGAAAPQIRYVGPALAQRARPGPPFPWQRLDGRPLVVVALGTVNAHATGRFLAACVGAVDLLDGRVQAAIADPSGVLGEGRPPDVITGPHLPFLDLVGRAAVVVCHGGHNTVCESLAHGVPLVVAPIRDDQPVIAEQVVEAGAGVRLRFTRATPQTIRDAVRTVLDGPGYRAAARRIKASFDVAGSAAVAADHLLALAARPAPIR